MSAKQRRKRAKRRRHAAGRAGARSRIVAGAGLTVGAVLGVGPSAQADVDVITVNSTTDPGDGTCDATECTLREAITETDDGDTTDVDRIVFAASVTGTITLNGTQLPTIDEPLYIQGPGADVLAVSGANASRILYIDTPADEDVTVSGLTLTDGIGAPGPNQGGAIRNLDADLTILSSTISGNSAKYGGGVWSGSSVTILSSTISGNTAKYGGGVYSDGGTTTIRDSTISGNSVSGKYYGIGGGLFLNSGTTTIESTTIAGNSATGDANARGGGVFSNDGSADPILANTLLANNTAPTGPELFSSNDIFQVAFSLIEDPTGAPVNTTVPGSNITGVDPQLGALADNGGPTETHALPEGSPAVDQAASLRPADQRGLLRRVNQTDTDSPVSGANCSDIGAFEQQLGAGGPGPTCTAGAPLQPGDNTPPETQITGGPKQKTVKKQANFAFTSSEAGSSFGCQLDGGPFVPCSSPWHVQVKKGKHIFSVQATDAAGNVDQTPATDDWKVKKKKKN